MTTDLMVTHDTALSITREPEVVLEEAHRAAKALKAVIDGKPDKVMFGGHQYLTFEDWQTVGRFYGIAPRVLLTRPVTIGEFTGWESSAEAVHVESGRVISSADAMCMTDEEKWRARPKYAWVYHKKSGGTSVEDPGKDELIWEQGQDGKRRPKKSKELIGEETVPLFQLRSMAQTRAAAKALRNALAWVVVLAGYKPTPAEELPESREEPRQFVGEVVGDGGATLAHPDTVEQARQDTREMLLAAIRSREDELKMKGPERAAIWKKHCGTSSEPVATISALQALVKELADTVPF